MKDFCGAWLEGPGVGLESEESGRCPGLISHAVKVLPSLQLAHVLGVLASYRLVLC